MIGYAVPSIVYVIPLAGVNTGVAGDP